MQNNLKSLVLQQNIEINRRIKETNMNIEHKFETQMNSLKQLFQEMKIEKEITEVKVFNKGI